MPPLKKSKKNTTQDPHHENHHTDEDEGGALVIHSQQDTDQDRAAKLEALKKAKEENATEIPETSTKNDDEGAVGKELEQVNKKLQMLQK
jgi:hypothetical protein